MHHPFAPCGLSRSTNRTALRICNEYFSSFSQDHRRYLQREVAGGAFFQVDQAESQNKNLPGDQQERRDDPNLDSDGSNARPGLLQVHGKAKL